MKNGQKKKTHIGKRKPKPRSPHTQLFYVYDDRISLVRNGQKTHKQKKAQWKSPNSPHPHPAGKKKQNLSLSSWVEGEFPKWTSADDRTGDLVLFGTWKFAGLVTILAPASALLASTPVAPSKDFWWFWDLAWLAGDFGRFPHVGGDTAGLKKETITCIEIQKNKHFILFYKNDYMNLQDFFCGITFTCIQENQLSTAMNTIGIR